MNKEYNSKVSSKNSKCLLKNLEKKRHVVTFLPHPVHMIDAVIVTGTGGRCCIMRLADAACALTRGQHVSV